MNVELFDIEGKDEFVITPAPNCYLVTLRLDEKQAAAFDGNQRITLTIGAEGKDPDGSLRMGLLYVRGLTDDNQPSDYKLDGAEESCDFTPEQEAILTSDQISTRVQNNVEVFFNAVKGDLGEYYQHVDMMRVLGQLTA